MKKKMEQLLSGNFEYEQPQLLFSQDKIAVTLKAGETRKGDLYLGTDNNEKIRGFVTSSNRRVVPGFDKFSGTTVCLPYGVDGTGMEPGDCLEGWLCFTTNIGEYKFPFIVKIEQEQIRSSAGEVKTVDAFREIAKEDFREAYRIFTDKSFPMILKDRGNKELALYAGMSRQPVTYQHLEEYFISSGLKDQVNLSLKKPGAEFHEVQETVQESFTIQRSGWGHLRLDVETKGDFLEVTRRVVTEEDFIGSSYQVDYVIHREKLGRGNQFGEIIVKSPYQELTFHIMASRSSKVRVNMNIGEKRHKLSLLRDYLAYSCGRMDFKTWVGSSHFILNQLWEAGCDYPEYQMYEAYLLHLEGDDKGASEILLKYQDKSFTKEDLEFAGIYLYLCTLTGLYTDKAQALRRIQNFYMQKEDSFQLFRILLKIDPATKSSPSKVIFMMEELFERGCRSPLLYLEAWNYISRDMSLLHRLSGFWAQVFLFAGKERLFTEELVMRFAYLSGYEKNFSQSLYRAMSMGYEAYPSEDTLEAICKYIMKGNPRKPEYFRWYSLAVDQGLRLTRLFEYYVETMDTSYQRELPKPLLMYFTYNNNTLGDAKKAFIYASVIAHKEQEPQTYESYRESMRTFASQKLNEGRMNENYAAVYQEFLSSPQNKEEAEALSRRMFTCRLYCDDKKIRHVIVRHCQMEREEIYPCVQGVAYPRIYTEDAVILFQDEKQRRYTSTVAFNVKKLMDEREMIPAVLNYGVTEPGVLLHYCESTAPGRDNLDVFQALVRSEAYTENYKRSVRMQILDYYASHVHGEDLDDYLKKMDFREYAMVDRTTLVETLAARGLFPQALGIIEEFGFEGLDMGCLLKLTSRMIIRCEMAEDEELLALASEVYRRGKYDEVILRYLMKYRFGPVDEIFSIWKSAKGFEMDTYDLEERIIGLLMFTSDYRKDGETVLQDYMKQSGKERIIGAYLTQLAYGSFVKEYPLSPFGRKCLEYAYVRKWPVNVVCRLALLKALSKEKDGKGEYLKMEKELLSECTGMGMAFAFFRRLSPQLLSPYQLDDKTFVEYHANPKAKVTLFYAMDTGLGLEPEYKSEPLRNIYEGIFTKTFTLFYGETLHYYFQVEENGKSKKTAERVITMNKVDGTPMSKYQLINQILSARRLEKDQEVVSKMKQYLRQEQYVKEMFVIKKEA
ncbi:MAG: DUF5717 family protein [Eubacteriales bacterium]|nr:DUF5717 family protein [Eubacteriales bacterium]